MAKNIRKADALIVPKEIEEQTAALWLQISTVTETSRGQENTYYVDQFGNEFFCKNYPR